MTAQIINLSEDDARTMTALRSSIAFYKDNNSTGIYDRALQKETKMLQQYMINLLNPQEIAA